MLLLIASGRDGFSAKDSGFASNGYGDRSPMGYDLLACLVIEVLLTAVFLWVILGATDSRAPKGMAPLAIGLSLTLIHLISIPVTNTSVNPARSIGVGLFAGSDAISQLWLFILAPIVGGLIAGFTYATLLGDDGPSASRGHGDLSAVLTTAGAHAPAVVHVAMKRISSRPYVIPGCAAARCCWVSSTSSSSSWALITSPHGQDSRVFMAPA